jgi:SAM-dependent methyltransferase
MTEGPAGWAEPLHARVLDAAGVGAGTRVLDLGCGTGTFAAAAVARGARVRGIDTDPRPSRGRDAACRRRSSPSGTRTTWAIPARSTWPRPCSCSGTSPTRGGCSPRRAGWRRSSP